MRKVRGTRDIISFDSYIDFFGKIREHLGLYSFTEIHDALRLIEDPSIEKGKVVLFF